MYFVKLNCLIHAAAAAMDFPAQKYPLPPESVTPVIGNVGPVNWRGIIEQIRFECNSIDVFNYSQGPKAALEATYKVIMANEAQVPLCNFLLCTHKKNKEKELTFLELNEEIPVEYNKLLVSTLENIVYEQIVHHTGFLVAIAQYIETTARKFFNDIEPETYLHIFNAALCHLYPMVFSCFKRYNIPSIVPTIRGLLTICMEDVKLYLDTVNGLLKNYLSDLIERLRALEEYTERDDVKADSLNELISYAAVLMKQAQEINEKELENIQIKHYSTAAFFQRNGSFMKAAMTGMLQTSLARDKLRVRAYKSVGEKVLTIYSLEVKNMELKYIILVAMPINKLSVDKIEDAYRKNYISKEEFLNVLSIWMMLCKMCLVCSGFTKEERFICYLRYLCSDGSFREFGEEEKRIYFYPIALYVDVMFCYRNALVQLKNVIPGLPDFINNGTFKEYDLENGFVNIIDPKLKICVKNPTSIALLTDLVNKAYAEFKENGPAGTLLPQLRDTSNKPMLTKSILLLNCIEDVITAAVNACTAQQDAIRAAELAKNAEMRDAVRKKREVKRQERILKFEEEQEKLRKQEEEASRKNKKNRKRKEKKKQAARARVEEQRNGVESIAATEEAEEGDGIKNSFKTGAVKELPASSGALETLQDSLACSLPLSSGSSVSGSDFLDCNIPFRVLTYEESLPKLAQVLSDMHGPDTCSLHQSVWHWVGSRDDPGVSEKAYHCHDLIEFIEVFSNGEEMARYFLLIVCEFAAQEYINLYALARLYIAGEGVWHTESGYLVASGFYSKIRYGNTGKRFNLHHLRISSTQSLQSARCPASVVLNSKKVLMKGARTATNSDKPCMLSSPLRGFFQKDGDIQECRLLSDSASGSVYLVYYVQTSKGKMISRILELMPLSVGNVAHVEQWALAQFQYFLDTNMYTK